MDGIAVLLLQRLRGLKQLVHSLFLHDPAEVQEAHAVGLGRIEPERIFLQVDPGALQNRDAGLRNDPPIQEFLRVALVLEEAFFSALRYITVTSCAISGFWNAVPSPCTFTQ